MGIFSFFSKEKKETLDKGLSKTKDMTEVKLCSEVNPVINYFMPCKKIHT